MEFLVVTLRMYGASAIKAGLRVVRCWPMIPGAVALFFMFRLVGQIFGGMGFGGQLLVSSLGLALLGLFYQWVAAAAEGEKLTFRGLLNYDYQRFFELISVGFVLFIIRFPFDLLAQTLAPLTILVINVIVVTLVNPVAEILVFRRAAGAEALLDALNFMQRSWIEWLLPILLLAVPLLAWSPQSALLAFAQSDPLAPVYNAFRMFWGFQRYFTFPGIEILFIGLAVWFAVFRAALFLELESGSRRQRVFRARMK